MINRLDDDSQVGSEGGRVNKILAGRIRGLEESDSKKRGVIRLDWVGLILADRLEQLIKWDMVGFGFSIVGVCMYRDEKEAVSGS